ncbi:unnamed protein product [Candidula unifasciata]|uniref:Hydroxylysine kinase n=1 Tax=Candidula unifasciata TaxID=100452 RepID=A0A8S3YS21_9EUPU|nr:unnamed protein product [Candidula unifasciata]
MSLSISRSKEEVKTVNTTSAKEDGSELSAVPLCPYFENLELIKEMIKTNYGFTVAQLKRLNGYDDLNYHVLVDSDHNNPYIGDVSPVGYFLKICNSRDSQRPEFMDAQIAVMEHLLKKGILCQSPIKGVNGDDITECITACKEGINVRYLVSLRTYIPGTIIADVRLTPNLLYKVGHYVAKVTQALENFEHPFYETFQCPWSMDNIPKLKEALFAVKDDAMRQIAEEVIEAYNSEVEPSKKDFRTGQIHGDINEQNILVTEETASTPEICGLLDFQDVAKSFPIYDLAMSVAYMIMTKLCEVPVLDVPGHILAGYMSLLELTPAEKAAFKNLVAGRMVQSLVMGAYTYSLDPTNEYLLTTAQCGWEALKIFWETSELQLQQRWDDIVDTYN